MIYEICFKVNRLNFYYIYSMNIVFYSNLYYRYIDKYLFY